MKKKSRTSWCVFDLDKKESEYRKLQKLSESNDLWNNPENAKQVMKNLSSLGDEISGWKKLIQKVNDTIELLEMDDSSMLEDLEVEVTSIEEEVSQREFDAMLSGEYDQGDALLAIHAGAGGTDSQDWAAMLQRMYLRWIEAHGYESEILDTTVGEEAGIKSATIAVNGRYAYGYLKSEKGVHRLVRLSPFDANNRRHTSFVMIEVLPQVEDKTSIEINPSDLRIDTYRSAGAGGQNVQKNDTAVRITHLPSGLVVTCQNERSQTQNRENAMRVLRSRLLEIQTQEQADQIAELRGEYTKAEWGSQIRSYVLHPYQMVKDHRTEFEVGNAQSVLDGNLDDLIKAYLQSTVGDDNR